MADILTPSAGGETLDEFDTYRIAPLHPAESRRLQVLHGLGILDTDPEARFDDLTALATYVAGTPISAVSLVDRDRQWFKSRVGLSDPETHRDMAFCAHAILGDGPLVVPDATADARFAGNPLVTGDLGIRAYLGVPVQIPGEPPIGTLCVIDTQPREFAAEQVAALEAIARQVEHQLMVSAVVAEQVDAIHRMERRSQQLRVMAELDPLTGLANRAAVMSRLGRMLDESRSELVVVVAVDLDCFKGVNDKFGHAVGDEAIIATARALSGAVRDSDVVGRMGGDEFVAIAATTPAGRDRIIERVEAVADSGIDVGGRDLRVTLSAGYTVVRPGADLRTALEEADTALFAAKRRGRAQVAAFDHDRMTAPSDGSFGVEAVRHALVTGEIRPWYQPICDLTDGGLRPFGFEALARWIHPTAGVLAPGRFLESVERGELSLTFDSCMLSAVVDQMGARPAGDLCIAVNLSAPSVSDAEMADHVLTVLDDREIEPGCLTIEVTEQSLLRYPAIAAANLVRLRQRGVRIALDDFGTGASSLAHLRDLPVDELKIDRSFVARAREDSRSRDIVTAIVAVAESLRLDTVGEGVEDDDTLELLRECRVDRAQGYLISKPQPAEAILL